jgi:hypothetical protein
VGRRPCSIWASFFDQEATAITAILNKQRRGTKTRTVTPPTADGTRIRYHVDVDET